MNAFSTFVKISPLAIALGVALGSLAPVTSAVANTDTVTIGGLVISAAGTQQVNITGTATYSEPTQHLVITLDGVEILDDHDEPANWSTGLVTVSAGDHTIVATIYDKSAHSVVMATATLSFTVPSTSGGGSSGGSGGSGSSSSGGGGDGPDCCPGPDPEPEVAAAAQVKGTSTAVAGGDLARIAPLNSLFRQAYDRDPTFAEWEHWANRFFTEGKFWSSGTAKVGSPQYDVWLGAMQWSALNG